MKYSNEQFKKILEQAPECNFKCSWCGSDSHWTCVDFLETDYGTTIYEYECTNQDATFDDGNACGRTASQEFEDENPAS